MTGSELNNSKSSLAQRRKGAKKTLRNAVALCAFAPLREKDFLPSAERLASLVLAFFCLGASGMAQSYSLRSPDQRIEVRVRAADRLSYDVLLNGSVLLQNSTLSMNINNANLGTQTRVKATKQRSENKEIVSPVPQKSIRIREH